MTFATKIACKQYLAVQRIIFWTDYFYLGHNQNYMYKYKQYVKVLDKEKKVVW